jgi:hypothetical protein
MKVTGKNTGEGKETKGQQNGKTGHRNCLNKERNEERRCGMTGWTNRMKRNGVKERGA